MKWRNFPQNVKVRLITSFFNRLTSSAIMPFMALFFAQNLNKVWAGIFLVITVIISFIFNLIGGYISDRFNRKKILLITSSLSALMFLLMTISLIPETKIIGLFAIAYIAFTITSSMEYPTMDALIIDSTTPENRKFIYAADYWLVNLSMAIGTAAGGLLYVNHQLLLFVILTVTLICISIAFMLWLNETDRVLLKQKHQNVLVDVLNNYKIALQDGPFVKVVVGSMLIIGAELTLNNYIGVRLVESFDSIFLGSFEISGVRMLSLLNVENMLIVVILTFIVTKITDRFSTKKMLIFGFILYGIGYTIITSGNVWYVLIFFNFIATMGELIYSPIVNAEQANMMPKDQRGSYAAFANLGYTGGDLIARFSIIMGVFLMPSQMSIYMGIIILAGSILLYTGLFKRKLVTVKSIAEA
ncbi:MDR family MFS transporter [Ureibacillus endophyticus]|uniref:MFS transporter n=1 Tax=Ureibacillus endophyticus TaxID=1978490 RepID=A0A494ZA18_9BACL|nr:MFS transporter [Lysinibacillus endophyticus]RKQ19509.1 MFS transporter [Lysinibacillus endophyticus]